MTPEQKAMVTEAAKLAVQFSTYFVIAPPPSRELTPDEKFNNGTVTLLELEGRRYGITNSHVLDAYRTRRAAGEDLICQVGNVRINPLDRLMDESDQRKLDLAILDFSDIDANSLRGGDSVPCQFHVPAAWPPDRPPEGSFVALGGWPKSRRMMIAPDQVDFGAVCSGGTEVQGSYEDLLRCAIQPDEAEILFDMQGKGIPELPGMSGGPVIIGRDIDGIMRFELVGVIFEFFEPFDALRIRPTTLIRKNGTLVV